MQLYHFCNKIMLFMFRKIIVVCFDSIRPNKQLFSYVKTGLPGLNKS